MPTDTSPHSFRAALPQLFLLASVFFLAFVARIIAAPLMPLIEAELHISHSAGGSIFFFITFGYVMAILFSPNLSARIGTRRTICLSSILTGGGLLLFSRCHSLEAFQGAGLAIGVSAGFYLPAAMATIAEITPRAWLTRGMAIHELAPNLGFVVAPLVASLLTLLTGWRSGLLLMGAIMAGWGLLYLRRGCEVSRRQPPLSRAVVRHFFFDGLFWRITIMLCFASSSTMAVYSMLPLLLVNVHGMEVEHANSLVGLSRVVSVVMPLAGGWLGDRFGNGRVMVAVLLTTGMLSVPLGLCHGGALLLVIFLQAVVAVTFFPSCFARYARLGEGEFRGMAVSLGVPIGFLVGGGCLPVVIGMVGDHFGLDVGFVVAGALMIAAALLAGSSRRLLQRDR